MVAQLTLDQLVKVRILVPQLQRASQKGRFTVTAWGTPVYLMSLGGHQ